MELSTSNKGLINDWEPVEKMFRSKELHKTQGRYLIAKNELNKTDIEFIDEYLDKWLGYCEETLFDINLSIIDDKNVMAISQNSLVYDRLESLDIKVHKVPFRHRFFWDGGLHCITNDLVRKS
jgi:arginine deiminase